MNTSDIFENNNLKINKNYLFKVIDPQNDTRWDSFVYKHPRGSIYHLTAWMKVITSTYKHLAVPVVLENQDSGELEGIIPFILIRSRLTGKRLVSLPFTSYCENLMPERYLLEAVQFAFNSFPDINYIEIKFLDDSAYLTNSLETNKIYLIHILDCSVGLDELEKSFHCSSVRQRIRRADRSGLSFRISETGQDLKNFYDLEIKVRRKHGLPPQPFSFFANMQMILGVKDNFFIAIVEKNKKVIAAALVLKYKNIFHLEYSACDYENIKLSPNQKLFWEIIKMAHTGGVHYVDFGRSSIYNSSLIEFKERWGTVAKPLNYYYYPRSKRMNSEKVTSRKILEFTNLHIPASLLRLEGKILYPHLG